MITPVVHASFEYSVQGHTIILDPSVNDSDYEYYKWKVRAINTDEWFETRWIPVEDLESKRMSLRYDETYHVQLFVKNGSSQQHTGEYISIGPKKSLESISETDVSEETIDYFRHVPQPFLTLFDEVNPIILIIFLCVIFGFSIWFVLWDDRVILFKRMKK